MNRHEQAELKKWIREHEVDFEGVRFVNVQWLMVQIEEMCAAEDMPTRGQMLQSFYAAHK